MRPALKKLAQIEALEPDWDGYGGVPPSDRSLAMAQAIMLRMVAHFDRCGVPAEVMPIADGGVQLEWQSEAGVLALNAAPDGSWSYLLIEHGTGGRTFTERYGLSDDEANALTSTFLGR